MQAVILTAGQGTRLQPVTRFAPKSLLPFWGTPFISYQLRALEGLVEEVIIVEAPGRPIASVLGDRHVSLSLRYACQAQPLGAGDAALAAREMIVGPFLLLLGDTLPSQDTLQQVLEAPGQAVLTVIEVDDPANHFGVSLDDARRVLGMRTNANTVDTGVFRFDPEILDMMAGLEPLDGELRVSQGIQRMLERGADVRAVHMPYPWLQFGDHEGVAGVLRVMRHLRVIAQQPWGPGESCVMLPVRDCHIENSLIFGPGSLADCTVRDSLLYCATDAVGRTVVNTIAALHDA